MTEPLRPDEVDLRFELTSEDVVDGSMAMTQGARAVRTVQNGVVIGGAAFITASLLLTAPGTSGLFMASAAVLGFLLFQRLIVPRIQREQVSGTVKAGRNLYLRGEHHLRCDAEGLTYGSWAAEVRVRWAAIERTLVTSEVVLLYYGGNRALIIPRRAFASDEQVERFVAMAQALGDGAYRQLAGRSAGPSRPAALEPATPDPPPSGR